MDTSANLPFELKIETLNVNKETAVKEVIALDEFYFSVSDLKYQNNVQLKIKEYSPLKIFLSSIKDDMSVRLEMDGFDAVDIKELINPDGVYVSSNSGWIEVFNYENFPLPPGLYVLTVSVDAIKYFTSFEVLPNTMGSMSIWQKMLKDVLDDVNEQVSNYAYIRKETVIANHNNDVPNLVSEITIFNNYFGKVVAALDDISKNPQNKLIKRYVACRNGEVKHKTDYKVLRLNCIKNGNNGKCFGVTKVVDYDLISNRYLKRMLKKLHLLTLELLYKTQKEIDFLTNVVERPDDKNQKGLPEYVRNVKALNGLKECYDKIEKVRIKINMLLRMGWIGDVKELQGDGVPTQSLSEPRYNIVYNLYSSLDKISNAYSYDEKLTLLWKRTSTLYEYWAFTKIAKAFLNFGYKLEGCEHATQISNDLKFYSLSTDTELVLKNKENNSVIKIYYDKNLPRISGNDDLGVLNKDSQPLYTTGFNYKPDCILNFYKVNKNGSADYFLGSLIIDFKYRKLKNFWDERNKFKTSCGIGYSNKQLLSYKNDVRTVFFGNCSGEGDDKSSSLICPVHEVWAIYPDINNEEYTHYERGLGIRLISLVPGNERVLLSKIGRFLEDIL